MTLAKSLPHNIRIVDGNQLQVFIDQTSGLIYLKDIYGNIAPLSNYLGPFLENIGTGARVFAENVGLPAQLRTLTQGTNVLITQNTNDIEISVPSISGITLNRGEFISTQTQTTVGNEIKKVTFNVTNISVGVSVQNNSEILIQQAGDYNIAHSIQIVRTQGGGMAQFYLWLIKNGNPVANTNTKLTLANNNTFVAAAWNFFTTAAANDKYELGWYSTSQFVELHADPSPVVGLPAIPSVICTVNRIG